MKQVHAIGIACIVVALILLGGCTSTTPPAPTPVPVTTTVTMAPEPTLWPGALPLNQEVPFGIAGKNGTATVYKAEVRSSYAWSSPSYNSPREQQQAGESPFGTQAGYNTEKPKDGNTFLFVYVRLLNTGTERMVAPSPNQFVVHYNGMTYPYSSVRGSDVTVSVVRVPQYDYQIGSGGVSGSLMPGAGSAADGFLIYEVPATIDLAKATMVVTLDPGHTSAWRLG